MERASSSREPRKARLLDVAMRPFSGARPSVAAQVSGRTLEVGAGTGLNLPHFPDDAELVVVEPDGRLRRSLVNRIRAAPRPVVVVAATADALPFPDASFDTVLFSFALCTIPDPVRALDEAHRVLVVGGRLVLVEHVRSRWRVEHAAQRALTPLWVRIGDGCHLDRDPRALLRGFVVEETLAVSVPRLPLFPVDALLARKADAR